jgi:hypothetical protein
VRKPAEHVAFLIVGIGQQRPRLRPVAGEDHLVEHRLRAVGEGDLRHTARAGDPHRRPTVRHGTRPSRATSRATYSRLPPSTVRQRCRSSSPDRRSWFEKKLTKLSAGKSSMRATGVDQIAPPIGRM